MPPPAHSAATPMPPPRRCRSPSSVVTIRPPVAATGWPRLQPLPLTLTVSGSRPSIRVLATATEANASLISNSFTSDSEMPARDSAFGIASVGASPVRTGSTPTDAQPLTTPSGVSPCAAATSAEVRTTADAASLMPEELPAVMENPGISGCSTLSPASRSMEVLRRGCSSVSKTISAPAAVRTLSGTISAANRPSSIAAIARRWERSAHSSISSRETPASCAVFQPTVIDMSSNGASGVPGCDRGIQRSSHSWVPGIRERIAGAVDTDSAPPAITARSIPAMIPAAAAWIADRLEAHCRWAARPGTDIRPALIAACLAMSPPPCMTSPKITSSISAGSSPDRWTASSITADASSIAGVSVRLPLKDVPMAVRHAATMTASGTIGSR